MAEATELKRSDEFWNAQPCGGFDNFAERSAVRYKRDGWLTPYLAQTAKHASIIEVGCGQGTDTLTISRQMAPGGRYRAFDRSVESLRSAAEARAEIAGALPVYPELAKADALSLPVEAEEADCVYSCGVIHHVPDTEGALSEIGRVLKPGGLAFIALYRTFDPKVFIAHALRGMQAGLDKLTGKPQSVLRALEALGWDMPDGTTMVRECFGVPVLKSYTKSGLARLFADWDIVSMNPHGYMWMIVARRR